MMGVSVGELSERMRLVRLRRSNVWQIVRFELDGQVFEMRLVPTRAHRLNELSAESPVGAAMMMARAGDEMEVEAPGGYVVVKVLEISIGQDGEVG